MSDIDIAIIGGGIAGLSTAVGCARADVDAHVFEAKDEFKLVGTSLSLWPNAMKCLDEWGLSEALLEKGSIIQQISWRRPSGRAYFELPLNKIYNHIGYQGICVRRRDLHACLEKHISSHNRHMGYELVDFEHCEDKVELTFADGRKLSANHVIGADGIHSMLREKILGDGAPRYSGYGSWLGLSTAPSPNQESFEACEYVGRNGRFGVIETGNNTRYWFFVKNEKTPLMHAISQTPNDVLGHLQDWPDGFCELVANSIEENVVWVSFFDREVSKRWGEGRVTLIGDAIHPILPNLGQGACQSIEDAHAIVFGLKGDLKGDALRKWLEKHRYERCKEMMKNSRRTGSLAQNYRSLLPVFGFVNKTKPAIRSNQKLIKNQFTLPKLPVTE